VPGRHEGSRVEHAPDTEATALDTSSALGTAGVDGHGSHACKRRRTKTIPHAFGERAVMKLMYAALIRASQTWRGVPITEFERIQLDALRDELNAQFEKRHASPTQRASRSRNYSNQGT
jgi:hypothetical protein